MSAAPEPLDAVRPQLLPKAARYWEGSVKIQPNLPPGCKSSNGHGSRITPWIRSVRGAGARQHFSPRLGDAENALRPKPLHHGKVPAIRRRLKC